MSIVNTIERAHLDAARTNVLKRIRGHRRVRTVFIACGVIVVAATSLGAAGLVQQLSPHAIATTIVCYAHDDLNSLSGTVGVPDQTTSKTGVVTTTESVDKTQLCALVWRAGLAQAAENGGHWPDVDPNTSTLSVPTLAYCLLGNGQTGGFPIESPAKTAGEVCSRLGLAEDQTLRP